MTPNRPGTRGIVALGITFRRSAALVLTMLALASCASGTLFRANFDADTPGALPDTTPPGAPTGDTIYVSDPTNTLAQLVVVNSGALASKSVRYSNVNVPVPSRLVGFISKEEALPAGQKFRAIWVGRADLSASGSPLDIWFGDSHFKALAAMRLHNGQVQLRTSNAPQYENIGTYSESENHTVIITVDKGAQQYSIVMTPNSVLSGWRPVLDPSALATNRPTLYFHFGEAASSSARYEADNIVIEKVK